MTENRTAIKNYGKLIHLSPLHFHGGMHVTAQRCFNIGMP